jgi:hypothetical protein
MKDWFTKSFTRDNDPLYSSYTSWLEQLKQEKDSSLQLAATCGSSAAKQEFRSVLDARSERFRKAERRETDWLVEWLQTSIKHDLVRPYNIFQSVYMHNMWHDMSLTEACEADRKGGRNKRGGKKRRLK